MDIVKLIETLKAQGLSDEMIEEVLKNASEQEDTHYNVKQASAYLVDKLDKSWNPAKVRRFITSGQLQTVNQIDRKGQVGSSTKEGYLIDKQVLETFIEDQSKTKEDWKKEALALREEVQALQAKITSLQEERSSTKSSNAVLGLSTDLNEPLKSEEVRPLEASKKPDKEESEQQKIKGQVELHEVLEEMEKEGQTHQDISHLLEEHVPVLKKQDAELLVTYALFTNEQFQGTHEELTRKFMETVFSKTDEVKWFREEDEKYTALAKKRRYIYSTPFEAILNTLIELKKEKQ